MASCSKLERPREDVSGITSTDSRVVGSEENLDLSISAGTVVVKRR
jgi:hypothetical protein